ncbi:MAG TPA: sulfatase, partial [Actinomycetota bacterium]|nr:sulfatase [Actinomycetota bacterium]
MGRTKTWGVVGALVVAAASAGGAPGRAAQSDPPARPNVLIVITDDQRASGTMGVMPLTQRWFSDGGTHYVNAIATTPTCCPSRASVMTGLYAHNHGVHTSQAGEAENMDQLLTLQRYLRRDGYLTAIYGKYLNAWPREIDPPWFDDWAILSDSTARAYFNGRWNVNGKIGKLKPYSTRIIERKALRFLAASEAADDQPWLMYLAPMSPHLPAKPHPLHRGIDVPAFRKTPAMKEEDRSDKPQEVQQQEVDWKTVREWRRKQLRSLMSVDEMVGAVFRRLRRTGEARDTLAIYLSDNGFLWGEHGLGQKIRPYEASAEVPFFVRWPGHVPAGEVDERLVANIDIAPTVMEAARSDAEHAYDGRSFLGPPHDRVLLEQWKRPDRSVPNWAATRADDYLYVEYYAEDRLIPAFREYYDLVEDPWELHNLLGDLDPTNDPPDAVDLSLQLHRDVICAGTSGPS